MKWAEIIEFEKSNVQKLEDPAPGQPTSQLHARVKHVRVGVCPSRNSAVLARIAHWHESEGRLDEADVQQRARDASRTVPFSPLRMLT